MSGFEKVGVILVTGLVAVILAMSFFGTGQDPARARRGEAPLQARAERGRSPRPRERPRGEPAPAASGLRAPERKGSPGGSPAVRPTMPASRGNGMTATGAPPVGVEVPWEQARTQRPVGSGIDFGRRGAGPARARAGREIPTGSVPGRGKGAAPSPGTASLGTASPGTASPGTASPGTASHGRTHVVRAGDSLCSIAARLYGSERLWTRIRDANPGIDPRALPVGKELRIPPAPAAKPIHASHTSAAAGGADHAPGGSAGKRVYRVSPGDSLIRIARDHLKDPRKWKEILALNRDRIRDPDLLRVGQTLVLPR